jgi:hypothetical protein
MCYVNTHTLKKSLKDHLSPYKQRHYSQRGPLRYHSNYLRRLFVEPCVGSFQSDHLGTGVDCSILRYEYSKIGLMHVLNTRTDLFGGMEDLFRRACFLANVINMKSPLEVFGDD